MKEMEKGDEELGFSLRKSFHFSYKRMASLSWYLQDFQSFINTYQKPLTTPHSCVCVCWQKNSGWCSLQSTQIVQLPTCQSPQVTRWSRGARLHSQTNTCHVDFTGSLGRKLVASRPRDLELMQLPVFKERLKYTIPTYMKTQKTIHHQKYITYKVLSLIKPT